METNKYYTPTLDEIYLGFELEWQSKIRNESWNKQICDTDLISIIYDEYEHADEEPFNEQFRVKYLDRSDIESIIHINAGKDFTTHFKLRESYDDELIFQTYWIEENEFLDEEYIYWDIKYNIIKITHKSHTLFSGTIKNKSELIKLLKMLNV